MNTKIKNKVETKNSTESHKKNFFLFLCKDRTKPNENTEDNYEKEETGSTLESLNNRINKSFSSIISKVTYGFTAMIYKELWDSYGINISILEIKLDSSDIRAFLMQNEFFMDMNLVKNDSKGDIKSIVHQYVMQILSSISIINSMSMLKKYVSENHIVYKYDSDAISNGHDNCRIVFNIEILTNLYNYAEILQIAKSLAENPNIVAPINQQIHDLASEIDADVIIRNGKGELYTLGYAPSEDIEDIKKEFLCHMYLSLDESLNTIDSFPRKSEYRDEMQTIPIASSENNDFHGGWSIDLISINNNINVVVDKAERLLCDNYKITNIDEAEKVLLGNPVSEDGEKIEVDKENEGNEGDAKTVFDADSNNLESSLRKRFSDSKNTESVVEN